MLSIIKQQEVVKLEDGGAGGIVSEKGGDGCPTTLSELR